MRAPARLVRPHHADSAHRFLVRRLGRAQHPGDVVAVRQRHATFTGRHRQDLVGVPTLGRAGEVGDQATRPGFGLRLAVVGDQRAAERQVVRMRARAHADLALQRRVGEVLVVQDLLALESDLVVDDDAGAGRERVPVRRAQRGRHTRFQRGGLDRLEQAELVGDLQPRGVHRDQQVGGAGRAFVADALDQLVFLAVDAVDLDAGGLGEVAVERLVGLVVAGGVDVEHLLLRERRQAEQRDGQCGSGGDEGAAGQVRHGGRIRERSGWMGMDWMNVINNHSHPQMQGMLP